MGYLRRNARVAHFILGGKCINTVAKRVSVLGAEYTIRFVEQGQDAYMEKMRFCDYCDANKHEIVILLLCTVMIRIAVCNGTAIPRKKRGQNQE